MGSLHPMTFSRNPDELTDDTLTDRVRILQRRHGHRYSVDDVATAWIALRAADPAARSCLDLGCGIGSVLLSVADRLPRARVVGVEAQAGSYALAERNVERNRLGKRTTVQFGDLRDNALLDRIRQAEAAFGQENGFDLVTGTPPYKPLGTATLSPDPQRAHARVELRGGVEDYQRAAARVISPNGVFVVCAQSDLAPRVAAGAAAARFKAVYRLDVIPRFARKSRLFSVHVFVPAGAADGGGHGHDNDSHFNAVSERLHATGPTVTVVDGDCACERLVLRDEAGERTSDARALRAYFGLYDEDTDAVDSAEDSLGNGSSLTPFPLVNVALEIEPNDSVG